MTQENHEDRITVSIFYMIGFASAYSAVRLNIPEWLIVLYMLVFVVVILLLMYTYYLNYSRK